MNARAYVESLEHSSVIASLDKWRRDERKASAMVVAHLMVLERERLHIDMGYASLFVYCTERLGYSSDAALKRIRAARAATVHPEVIDHLESGELTLSGVLVLAKHLTGGRVGAELIEAARGKSKRQVEELVAARFPDTDSLRGKLRVRPVGDGVFRLEVVVSRDVVDKLEEARDLDRHRNPTGNVEPILDEHDHVRARALGGEHSVENGRVLCGVHNRRVAEVEMGAKRYAEARRADASRSVLDEVEAGRA